MHLTQAEEQLHLENILLKDKIKELHRVVKLYEDGNYYTNLIEDKFENLVKFDE